MIDNFFVALMIFNCRLLFFFCAICNIDLPTASLLSQTHSHWEIKYTTLRKELIALRKHFLLLQLPGRDYSLNFNYLIRINVLNEIRF